MRVVIRDQPEFEGVVLAQWAEFDRVRSRARWALSDLGSTVAPDDVAPAGRRPRANP